MKGEAAEVNLYGEVVETVPIDFWTGERVDGLFIELKQFLTDLETLKDASEVTFRINSIGGDVEAGITIYNRIRELSGKTVTVVDGLAASAASIIAQAGDIRRVSVGAQTMIHGASAALVGYYNLDEVKRIEGMLSGINKSVAGIYAMRTGRSEEHILSMMTKEHWMTTDEALKEGFADEIVGEAEPVIDRIGGSRNIIMVNGIPHAFHQTPLPIMEVSNGIEPSDIEASIGTEGRSGMDLNELKTSHPELVEQIRNEAAQAAQKEVETAVQKALEGERARMKEIDLIAHTIGNDELIETAKYTEPISAAELALKVVKAQQAAGNEYLAARAEETAPADKVEATPCQGMEDTIAADEAELNDLINRIREGGK